MQNKGFTLIELLIVVAIIGILSSVGAVVISSVLENAKQKTANYNFINTKKLLETEFMKCAINDKAKILENFNCNSFNPPTSNQIINYLNNQVALKNPYDNSNAVSSQSCSTGSIGIQKAKCVGTYQVFTKLPNGQTVTQSLQTLWTPVNTSVKTCWTPVNTSNCAKWTTVKTNTNTVWNTVKTNAKNVWKNVGP